MHTRKQPRAWCLGCAAAVLAEIALLQNLPFELLEPGKTVFHMLAFTSLAMMLCIAFDVRFHKFGEKPKCAE
jgi:hypothetical protein